jgi:hypothetical protein
VPISAEPTREESQQGTAAALLPGKGSASPHLFNSANAPGYRPTRWRRREVGGIKLSVTDKKMPSARPMSALFCQRDSRKGEEKHRVLQTFYIVIHMFQKKGRLLLHTQHKKSAKSD